MNVVSVRVGLRDFILAASNGWPRGRGSHYNRRNPWCLATVMTRYRQGSSTQSRGN